MANIKEKIDNIRQAIFGKDVRESLASGLEEVNGESERTSEKQKKLETTFNDLIINAGNSNAEIVAARKGHETVGERLDNFDSQLDTIDNKTTNIITPEMFREDEDNDSTCFNKALDFACNNNKTLTLTQNYILDSFVINKSVNIEGNNHTIYDNDSNDISLTINNNCFSHERSF